VAEGVYTAREVQRLARQAGVDVPIASAVCGVLYEGVPPMDAVDALLARAQKDEEAG
jgi:glycerol-3-phosphate dehydrogenase (NAD(P)+)